MECACKRLSCDILMTCLGLVFLLVDLVLDTWAVVSFYQDKDYVSMGLLVLFLVGSSVLVQVYSWLWYYYDDNERLTRVESWLSLPALKLLHVFQLGIYLRHAGVFEVSICSCNRKDRYPKDKTMFLTHDLSMLRLIETFAESAPQLVLMLTLILRRGLLDPVTVLKAVASASAIACSMTMYHRSLRFFLPDKNRQRICSSFVFFLWNLLLLAPRLVALALFASVLPWFVLAHFGFSWLVLCAFAIRAQTNFMDSVAGERLFQATVGLIWFFSWFSVVDGKTRYKSLLYHIYVMADICFLCSLWCWRIYTQPPSVQLPFRNAVITSVCVVIVYMLGLSLKLLYYKLYHPNIGEHEVCGSTTTELPNGHVETPMFLCSNEDTVDSFQMDIEPDSACRSMPVEPEPVQKRQNKRMMKLADNFYS